MGKDRPRLDKYFSLSEVSVKLTVQKKDKLSKGAHGLTSFALTQGAWASDSQLKSSQQTRLGCWSLSKRRGSVRAMCLSLSHVLTQVSAGATAANHHSLASL